MIVTLTTDFGSSAYVAAMKGVLLDINPDLVVVDLAHDVAPQDVRQGAFALYTAAPHFPFAIHVGVVDPGVGTDRPALAIACEGALFVGPDNGLLVPAARRMGIKALYRLTNETYFRRPVSATFHGRDVFAPAAAHLSLGEKLSRMGEATTTFVDLDFGVPTRTDEGLAGAVICTDRFGNVVTNVPADVLEGAGMAGPTFAVRVGDHDLDVPFLRTYGDAPPGEVLATVGSSGFLELAVNRGSAAERLGVRGGEPLLLRSG
jgi:S-adenosylmethionine hydrolase